MILPGFFGLTSRLGYRRRWFLTILVLQLCAVLFEGVGVGMILPILEFVRSDGNIAALSEQSGLWRWMIDATQAIGIPLTLVTLMTGSLIAILVRQVFIYCRTVYTYWVQIELIKNLQNRGFHQFINAGLGYHDYAQPGEFVNELTKEMGSAVSTMTSAANFASAIIMCCVYTGIVLLLSPPLTGVSVLVLVAVSLVVVRLMHRLRGVGQQLTDANQKLTSFVVERLKAIRLVRLSGVETAEEAELMTRTQRQRDHQFDLRKMLAFLDVVMEPVIVAMAFVMLYIAVTYLKLPLETIVLFFFILLRLVPVVKVSVQQRQSYIAYLASVEVIDKRFSELGKAREPAGGTRELNELKDAIEFTDVEFRYGLSEDETPPAAALDGISLKIPANKMTALVGPSGAGKSTLIDILPRLRLPQSGVVSFDGIPQTEFSTESLRKAIAFAPQTPQIFDVTPAQHILYGRADASKDDILAAARSAQADEFIQLLPNGYDTPLGEGAIRLSGGQRQRLDLARALVRRAPVLILDEPTSNLDADAERQFRDALERIRTEANVTIIIIGHRLSTVQNADQIVVMQEGCITQVGTHDELLKQGGWYANAYAKQKLEQPLETMADE